MKITSVCRCTNCDTLYQDPIVNVPGVSQYIVNENYMAELTADGCPFCGSWSFLGMLRDEAIELVGTDSEFDEMYYVIVKEESWKEILLDLSKALAELKSNIKKRNE